MPTLTLEGVEVRFPYKPYPSQKQFMKKVILNLNEAYYPDRFTGKQPEPCTKNAFLESPTGTGKTLCILCATYAWLISYMKRTKGKKKVPRVLFAARTHAQLDQTVKEIKKTPYKPIVTQLGSRAQLCINEEVAAEEALWDKNRKCNALRSKHACEYYAPFEAMHGGQRQTSLYQDYTSRMTTEVQDIEDLVEEGKEVHRCPYYHVRRMKEEAEIVLLPYNYIFKPDIRDLTKLDMTNDIVIVDEAHNVPKICEDSLSSQFSTLTLAQCYGELQSILNKIKEKLSQTTLTDQDVARAELKHKAKEFEAFQGRLIAFEKHVNDVPMAYAPDGVKSKFYDGGWIYKAMEQYLNVTKHTIEHTNTMLFKAIKLAIDLGISTYALTHVQSGLSSLFFSSMDDVMLHSSYRVEVEQIDQYSSLDTAFYQDYMEAYQLASGRPRSKEYSRVVKLHCLNPTLAIKHILQTTPPRTFLFISATLTPLKIFSQELGLPATQTLENPHVISKSQLAVNIIKTGPSGTLLNADFTNRNQSSYQLEIGHSILNIVDQVPAGGTLVFFSSYSVLELCLEAWKGQSLYDTLTSNCRIFIEPKTTKELPPLMQNYQQCVASSMSSFQNKVSFKKPLFLAVCRGKLSEGFDFRDDACRALILVGLPFPPRVDPYVVLKQRACDLFHQEDENLPNGNAWYKSQCTRSVNQTLGRVIRYKDDFGAIFLLDERFHQRSNQDDLSCWLHRFVRVVPSFSKLNMRPFFDHNFNALRPSSTLSPAFANDKLSLSMVMDDFPDDDESLPSTCSSSEKASAVHQSRAASRDQFAQKFLHRVRESLSPIDFDRFFDEAKRFFVVQREPDKKNVVFALKRLLSSFPSLLFDLRLFVEPYAYLLDSIKPTKKKQVDLLTGRSSSSKRHLPRPPPPSHAMLHPSSSSSSSSPADFVDVDAVDAVVISDSDSDSNSHPPASSASSSNVVVVDADDLSASIAASSLPDLASLSSSSSSSSSNKPLPSCPVCLDTWSSPKVARCGHICCSSCWDRALSHKLECPSCRSRVRPQHLTTLYF